MALSSAKYPHVGISCIVQQKGKILLGRRKGAFAVGSFATPGGHLEFGETIEEGAIRELLEETGLQALSFRLGPWVENFIEDAQKHYVTIFVFVDSFVGEPTLREPNKCEGWQWHQWNCLPQPLFPSLASFLDLQCRENSNRN